MASSASLRPLAAVLLGALSLFAIRSAIGAEPPRPRPTPPPFGPPFDLFAETPHRATFAIDTAPARDVLTLVRGAPDAPAALKRLKTSRSATAAAGGEGRAAEDFWGRLAQAAAGTPDPLLSSYAARAEFFASVLQTFDTDGTQGALVESRRIASLLPLGKPVEARFVVVPFFVVGGFADVTAVDDGDTTFLVADLPRLTGEVRTAPPPREIVVKALRASASEAWKLLFAPFKKPPLFSDGKTPDLDALLSRTVAEGPATLFLFPDEFFPLESILDEPIGRAFTRWNAAAEVLADPKRPEAARSELLAESTRGEFWKRFAAVVGAQVTEAILRHAGREAYLKALAEGPRTVIALYVSVSKGKKLPAFSPAVKKALETRPAS